MNEPVDGLEGGLDCREDGRAKGRLKTGSLAVVETLVVPKLGMPLTRLAALVDGGGL